jgi:hypothetical protein
MDLFGRNLPPVGPVRTEGHSRTIVSLRGSLEKGNLSYLVDFDRLGPEYRQWRTVNQLGIDGPSLIAEFERRRGSG